jgi:hypothetical protein
MLIRAMLGIVALWQGGIYLSGRENLTGFSRISGLALYILGASL